MPSEPDNKPTITGTRDMVVPLLALPESVSLMESLKQRGIVVRRAQSGDRAKVCDFVASQWPDSAWTDEVSTAFTHTPLGIFIATQETEVVGFAAYDVDYRGVFGPTGVRPDCRGNGIGAILLLRCLQTMRELGYLYAIIGAVGPAAFYTKVCGALALPSEWPNYTDRDES